jgi:hypothetical protein
MSADTRRWFARKIFRRHGGIPHSLFCIQRRWSTVEAMFCFWGGRYRLRIEQVGILVMDI